MMTNDAEGKVVICFCTGHMGMRMMAQKQQARIMTTLSDWDIETGLGSGLGILKPPKQALVEAVLGRCSLQQTQLLLAILPRAQQLKGNERVRGATCIYV
jgi:hypothetical protein